MKYNDIRACLLGKQYVWLITGVAGFIGSHLMETLLNLNQKVVGIDNFATGYQHNIDEVLNKVTPNQARNFTFYKLDIRSLADCERAAIGVDYILHQAALGSVPRSILDPLATNDVNLNGFLNILMAAKSAKVKRLVYASSSSVYGDSPMLPKVEANLGKQLSPYAVSKYAGEIYAEVFSSCYGMETIGLRYFNVFGPRQDPSGAYAAVIPLWFRALLKGETLYINGDGETSRDFCYVGNVVQANLLAALTDNPSAVNSVYNIAVGEQTTLNELFANISSLLNKTQVNPSYRDHRAGDIKHSLANIDKAKSLLGYHPEYNVKAGLSLAAEWYLANL